KAVTCTVAEPPEAMFRLTLPASMVAVVELVNAAAPLSTLMLRGVTVTAVVPLVPVRFRLTAPLSMVALVGLFSVSVPVLTLALVLVVLAWVGRLALTSLVARLGLLSVTVAVLTLALSALPVTAVVPPLPVRFRLTLPLSIVAVLAPVIEIAPLLTVAVV